MSVKNNNHSPRMPVIVKGVQSLPDGHSRKVPYATVNGRPQYFLLCRLDGTLRAFDSTCPHEGAELIDGRLYNERFLFCPLHAYRFCPLSGTAVEVECAPLRKFRVEERGDTARIWVDSDRDG